jgi:tetratricopeptide (TPR) repeat protein
MRSLKAIALTAIAGLALVPEVSSAADVITRKSTDKKVGGAITAVSKTEVTIKPPAGDEIKIPVNDILAVDWNDAPAELNLGKGDEAGGRFESALARYAKVAEDARSNEMLKTDLEFLIARATARSALTDPEKRDEAIAKLTAFLKSNSNHFRVYDAQQFLGQVQLAKQDFDAARQAFEAVGQAPWNDFKLSSNVNLGRVLMAEGKLDEAAQAFDQAISAASAPDDVSAKYEAMVAKSRALIAQNKETEALTVLTDVVKNASPDETALLAEAYVLQGHCFEAASKPKDAVLAFLHVDVLFAREAAYHAEALYHLAKLWKVVQYPDRALEAQAKLEGTHPNSEWTKKLAAAPAE